jgi:hypothetical protein
MNRGSVNGVVLDVDGSGLLVERRKDNRFPRSRAVLPVRLR